MSKFEQVGLSIDDVTTNKAADKMIAVDPELLYETGHKGIKSMPSEEYKALIEKIYFK